MALIAGCHTGSPRASLPLRVGTSGDYAPFSSGAATLPVGFDIDVARRLALDLDRPLEIVPFRWATLADDLAADRFDVAMSGVTIRAERTLVGTFTRPVVETGAVLLVAPGHEVDGTHLSGATLRVGVNGGGHLERVARTRLPRATIMTFDNTTLPDHLLAGDVDAILTDELEAPTFSARLPGATRIGPLTRDRKAYLARTPALAAQIDAWLRSREADGTLASLRAQWLGAERANRGSAASSDAEALLAAIDLRAMLMPLVARAKRASGLPVHDPRREAEVIAAMTDAATRAGVAPHAALDVVEALMRAARAVQSAATPTPDAAAPDLRGVLRPAIDGVTRRIVELLAPASAPDFFATRRPQDLAERLDPVMPYPDRLAIARALLALGRTPTVDASTATDRVNAR